MNTIASASPVKLKQIVSEMSRNQETTVPVHNTNMVTPIVWMLRFIGNMLFVLAGILEANTSNISSTSPGSPASTRAEAETPPEGDLLPSSDANATAETSASPETHAEPLTPPTAAPGERSSVPPSAARETSSAPSPAASEPTVVPPPAAWERRYVYVTALNRQAGIGKFHNVRSCYGLRKAFQVERVNWLDTGSQTECSLCGL